MSHTMLTIIVWRVLGNGERILETECNSWSRAFSFFPNWGHIHIKTDWQGIHVIFTH